MRGENKMSNSRLLKFRAWDKVIKSMRYGAEHSLTMCIMNPNNFELMQFTGLKDKQGVEIYEGDICRRYWNDGSMQDGQIIFQDAQFLWQEIKGGIHFIHPIGINTLHSEVIGNIYEGENKLTAGVDK